MPKFYPAENYHRDYYAQNGAQTVLRRRRRPEVEKIKKLFADDLKTAE